MKNIGPESIKMQEIPQYVPKIQEKSHYDFMCIVLAMRFGLK